MQDCEKLNNHQFLAKLLDSAEKWVALCSRQSETCSNPLAKQIIAKKEESEPLHVGSESQLLQLVSSVQEHCVCGKVS